MTNTCIRLPRRTGGRVAFRDLTPYAADWTGQEGDRRPSSCNGVQACSEHARQSDRINADARLRMEYAAGSRPACTVCLLPGTFALLASEDARLIAGHVLSVALFGASNAINLTAQHVACNAAAGDRDLRGIVAPVVAPWPPKAAAERWATTPHRLHVPSHLPTAQDMQDARDARILADGSQGCGF